MKSFQSIFPAIPVLFLSLFIYGFNLSALSAPATTPFSVVAPSEGGTNPDLNQILLIVEINPPLGGQGGMNSQIVNTLGRQVGMNSQIVNTLGGQGGMNNHIVNTLGGQVGMIDMIHNPLDGLVYSDLKSSLGDLGVENTIKIGLLIQDSTSVDARNGAELAILTANKEGGYNGRMFELVVKSMEGPWGTGSKQAVDLIFTDKVLAIVGSHDGRNAHLVEQATTKANVTFLSAWSGDPSLSQAFTPWFFNAVPNYNQQADMLLDEIIRKKYTKITIVEDDDYDANSAFKSFIRKSGERGSPKPEIIKIDKSERDLSGTIEIIDKTGSDCLLLFTNPATAELIISGLTKMKIPPHIYGPLSLLEGSPAIYSNPGVSENLLLLSSGDWYQREKSDFAARYHKKFGSYPGANAAYAFDAMMVIIKAVKSAGAERDKIQKAMMGTDYNGATGNIKFDEKGNRICTAVRAK